MFELTDQVFIRVQPLLPADSRRGKPWRDHRQARVGQDQGGLVGPERHRPQRGGEGVAAVPEPPGRIQLEAASILSGVDYEHPTGPDHQVDAPYL